MDVWVFHLAALLRSEGTRSPTRSLGTIAPTRHDQRQISKGDIPGKTSDFLWIGIIRVSSVGGVDLVLFVGAILKR